MKKNGKITKNERKNYKIVGLWSEGYELNDRLKNKIWYQVKKFMNFENFVFSKNLFVHVLGFVMWKMWGICLEMESISCYPVFIFIFFELFDVLMKEPC